MIYKILMGVFLWVSTHNLFAQNERLFVGLEFGMYAPRSFHLPDSQYPDYFYLRNVSYEEYAGLVLTLRVSPKLSLYTGYDYMRFIESYDLGGRAKKPFLRDGEYGWGYTFHHFPFMLGYSIALIKKPKYTIRFIPRLGVVYSRTENVNLNSGHVNSVIINQHTGDTISSRPKGQDYAFLFTRNTLLPKIGLGFELEYFNKKNKIRKIQINFAYAKGFKKLHEHDIGPFWRQTKLSSRGTFFEVSISQHFAIADLIPKKNRQKIQSEYMYNKWYKILYLKR